MSSSDQNSKQAMNESPASSADIQHQWTVDQINDDLVKLQSCDDAQVELELPIAYLPINIKEGDLLSLQFSLMSGESAQIKADVELMVSMLTENDDGGDFSL